MTFKVTSSRAFAEYSLRYLSILAVGSLAFNADSGRHERFLPPSHEKIFQFLNGSTTSTRCWGHEPGCKEENRFLKPDCRGTKVDEESFHSEADFGYVGEKLRSLDRLCVPEKDGDSELLCSKSLHFCTGRKIGVDFRKISKDASKLIQYDMNVLSYGDIGGSCHVQQDFIARNSDYMSPLQSWAPEMRNFVRKDLKDYCEVTVEKPVIVMKLDAVVNIYHHFCDFFNLYASLLLNSTLDSGPDAFSRDVHILVWENQPYRSSLGSVMSVFTRHPVWNLNTFAGKKVCFKKVMFPLLPRMAFGLFYNTPLSTSKCSGSGLFRAFSEFITYRMNMDLPDTTSKEKVRVTVLNRLTPHRVILNLEDLVRKLDEGKFEVTVANFTHWRPEYKQQLEIIRKTDILVGIHGAGLTHMLFLPPWAAVFELYDCEDPECYRDLSRLRGLKHFSWTDREKLVMIPNDNVGYDVGSAQPKFSNYRFDPEEFLRIMNVAYNHVVTQDSFKSRDVTRDEL